jgi:D-xylose transport system substrate-binding protein
MKNVENFLTKQGDKVDVILAMNDGTAGGSVQALKGRNLNGKVLVTGQDGEMAALQRIVEGDQAMTVYKPDDALALVLAQTIMKVIKNEPLGETKTLNNGLRDVPAVLFQPLTVDKNNLVETLVKPGYVKMEDVYKNVPKDQWPK